MAIHLDEIDKALLNRIQSDFPITSQPFAAIGEDLGLDEREVIARVRRLREKDIIRRIGGNFSPEKLGFVSTLCAASVPEDKIDAFAEKVNQFNSVTHNYLRDNHFNVWFTFICPTMEEIEANLKEISEKTGVSEILNLPATHVFKIKAHFDL